MLIISIEIIKKMDERERCDTRCVVIRWNNNIAYSDSRKCW